VLLEQQRRKNDGTTPTLLEVAAQLRMYKLVDCIKRQVVTVVNDNNIIISSSSSVTVSAAASSSSPVE